MKDVLFVGGPWRNQRMKMVDPPTILHAPIRAKELAVQPAHDTPPESARFTYVEYVLFRPDEPKVNTPYRPDLYVYVLKELLWV